MRLFGIVRPLVLATIATATCAAQHGSLAANTESLTEVQQEKPPAECLTRTAEDFGMMTRSDYGAQAINSVAGPTPFLFTAVRASINQAIGRPKEWGQGTRGYALRSGSIYAEHVISQAFEQTVAYKLHEDNRYFGSGEHTFSRRFGYAVASTFLARHDNGSRSISVSALGGAVAAAFISRAWQPRSTTTVGDAAVSFGVTMTTRIGFNLARELSPRLFGRLLQ